MRNALTVALAALFLALAMPALAEEFDVADITCQDSGTDEEMVLLLYWLDGYLSGRTGDTRYSDEWMVELARAVEEACADDPARSIVGIVEELK